MTVTVDYTALFEEYLSKVIDWFSQLNYGHLVAELLVLVLAAAVAVVVHRKLGQFLLESTSAIDGRQLKRFTLRSLQRIVFPLSMLLVALVGKGVLQHLQVNVLLLKLVVPLMLSLAGIRLAVYVLRKGLRPGPAAKAWETLISTSIWLLVALHLLGWLPDITRALDAFGYTFGTVRISLFTVIEFAIAVGALMVLATWLSKAVEQGLSRSSHISAGIKVGLSKTFKFGLYTLAGLLSLNAAGIDLELRVWIYDPEDGVGNVRSDINVAIWTGFREAGITIPYPQRDLHVKAMPGQTAAP